MRKRKHNDLYIRVLEYADQYEKFHFDNLKKHVGIEDGSDNEYALIMEINNGSILKSNLGTAFYSRVINRSNHPDADLYLWMTVEDKFRLLEYKELKEARASSKTATWFATAALIISILATGYQIYIGEEENIKTYFNKNNNSIAVVNDE